MASENNTMGKRIMALRKAAGMTQEQLAEKLGVSPQAVSKWENDISCPDISALPLIASLFGVSTDQLLGIKEPARPNDPPAKKSAVRGIGIGPGILLIVLGAAFLISRTVELPFALWDVLWPAVLMGLSISVAIEHRSVLFLGAAFFCLYQLLRPLAIDMPPLHWNAIWPTALILIGLEIVLRRLFPSVFRSTKQPPEGHRFSGRSVCSYGLQDGFISCDTAFGEEHRAEDGCEIKGGNIKTSFGECTLDLSRCTFAPNAEFFAEVSFGSLNIILPQNIKVVADTANSLGSTDIHGEPAENALPITLSGKVSFGSIEISYK